MLVYPKEDVRAAQQVKAWLKAQVGDELVPEQLLVSDRTDACRGEGCSLVGERGGGAQLFETALHVRVRVYRAVI